jgi:hypothetical protein
MDLKNMKVNCVKAAVAQGVADVNVNIELAPNVSMHCGCLADMRDDCGDANYPTDFIDTLAVFIMMKTIKIITLLEVLLRGASG